MRGNHIFGAIKFSVAMVSLWAMTAQAHTQQQTKQLHVEQDSQTISPQVPTHTATYQKTITKTHSTPISLRFNAIAQNSDGKMSVVNCHDHYWLGNPKSQAKIADLRFYISNVHILTKDGKKVPLNLQENDHQQSDVALIDLENGEENCAERGNGDTNAVLQGVLQGKYRQSDLVGVAFEVAVPTAKNHSLFSAVDAPLNVQAMSWAWLSGRKFMKIEIAPKDKVHNLSDDTYAPLYNVHIGRTACTGEPATGEIACANDNRIAVNLQDPNWYKKTIVLDLNALFAQSDIRQNQTGAVGCMSAPNDTDCVGIFDTTGLAGNAQQIFSLVMVNDGVLDTPNPSPKKPQKKHHK